MHLNNIKDNTIIETTIEPLTGLKIVESRDHELTDFSRKLLQDFYLRKDETPQEGFARASLAWCGGDRNLAQRLYDAASQGWFMFASPVLSNAPLPGEKIRGMPISCFLSFVDDTLEGLMDHSTESRWLSVLGGGVGAHWSSVRSVSDKAPGPIPFIHTVDADMEAYKQGKVRRGSYAAYMDVSHPDIIEFLNIRVPTGDISRKCHSAGFHNAINITDDFMRAVETDSLWELHDPHDNELRETIKARELWNQILDVRYRTGEPYLYFIDTAKRAIPEAQQNIGLTTHGSNLCSEISLPTNSERTAVCCLSSLNAEKYDEWKDTTLVQDMIVMLDNILEYFVNNAPTPLFRAKFSAMRERALGLGLMGFHHYLQSHMIPFESEQARKVNKQMFNYIKSESVKSSERLARIHGECPDFITELTFSDNLNNTYQILSSDLVEITKDNSIITIRAFEVKIGDNIHLDNNLFVVENIT
jgi:ribonucleoside-diphosphate reductase alpha chain